EIFRQLLRRARVLAHRLAVDGAGSNPAILDEELFVGRFWLANQVLVGGWCAHELKLTHRWFVRQFTSEQPAAPREWQKDGPRLAHATAYGDNGQRPRKPRNITT